MTLQELRQMDDAEWARRLSRDLRPGMMMSSPGGGGIELIKPAPRCGDPATHGPVWHVKPLLPRGPRTTAYVQYFDVVTPQEAEDGR